MRDYIKERITFAKMLISIIPENPFEPFTFSFLCDELDKIEEKLICECTKECNKINGKSHIIKK